MLTKAALDLLAEHPEDQALAAGLALGASVPFDRVSKRMGQDALAAMPRAGVFLPLRLKAQLGRDVNLVRGSLNAYDPMSDTVYHDGTAAVAHEFGHAKSPFRRWLGRTGLAGLNLTNFINKKYTALPVVMAAHSASDDEDRTLSGTAVGVLGAAQAAQLAEEGGASLRGLAMLKNEVPPEQYQQARRAFARAFGSYAVPALGATTAAALLGTAVRGLRKYREEGE